MRLNAETREMGLAVLAIVLLSIALYQTITYTPHAP